MSRIFRHIKDGFMGVVRHFALSLSSISSVTVTLIIMALFLLLSANLTQITKQMESNVQIHVQVNADITDEATLKKIEAEIKSIPNVQNVKFSSKAEELEAFIVGNEAADAEQMFGGFRGENNPMLNSFLVTGASGDSLKTISNTISEMEGIYNSTYGGDATATFVTALEQVRNVGFIVVAALGIIAVFLISNTIRVSIHSRRREIGIMRTVGATNWYIRWPFIIEGMLIGMLGSLIPIIITIFGYQYLIVSSGGFLVSRMFSLVAASPLVYQVSGSLILIGGAVGALGSLLSVGKFLRWTR